MWIQISKHMRMLMIHTWSWICKIGGRSTMLISIRVFPPSYSTTSSKYLLNPSYMSMPSFATFTGRCENKSSFSWTDGLDCWVSAPVRRCRILPKKSLLNSQTIDLHLQLLSYLLTTLVLSALSGTPSNLKSAVSIWKMQLSMHSATSCCLPMPGVKYMQRMNWI